MEGCLCHTILFNRLGSAESLGTRTGVWLVYIYVYIYFLAYFLVQKPNKGISRANIWAANAG